MRWEGHPALSSLEQKSQNPHLASFLPPTAAGLELREQICCSEICVSYSSFSLLMSNNQLIFLMFGPGGGSHT
jgi:hypothetical protein